MEWNAFVFQTMFGDRLGFDEETHLLQKFYTNGGRVQSNGQGSVERTDVHDDPLHVRAVEEFHSFLFGHVRIQGEEKVNDHLKFVLDE